MHDLSAGTVLTPNHIMFARPVVEFASTETDAVLGRQLTAPVAAGYPIPRGTLAD